MYIYQFVVSGEKSSKDGDRTLKELEVYLQF